MPNFRATVYYKYNIGYDGLGGLIKRFIHEEVAEDEKEFRDKIQARYAPYCDEPVEFGPISRKRDG